MQADAIELYKKPGMQVDAIESLSVPTKGIISLMLCNTRIDEIFYLVESSFLCTN